MKRENSIGVVVVPASDHDTHTHKRIFVTYLFYLIQRKKVKKTKLLNDIHTHTQTNQTKNNAQNLIIPLIYKPFYYTTWGFGVLGFWGFGVKLLPKDLEHF